MNFGNEAGVRRCKLYDDPFAVAVRRSHATIRGRISITQFAKADHVIVTYGARSRLAEVDRELASRGLARRIAMEVPSFSMARTAILTSDLVLSAPERFLRSDPISDALTILRHPVHQRPQKHYMLWHERARRDPGSVWLREQLRAVAQAWRPPTRESRSGEQASPAPRRRWASLPATIIHMLRYPMDLESQIPADSNHRRQAALYQADS